MFAMLNSQHVKPGFNTATQLFCTGIQRKAAMQEMGLLGLPHQVLFAACCLLRSLGPLCSAVISVRTVSQLHGTLRLVWSPLPTGWVVLLLLLVVLSVLVAVEVEGKKVMENNQEAGTEHCHS